MSQFAAMNRDKATLKIVLEGEYGSWYSAMNIPDLYLRAFEPLKTCDNPIIAWITGETLYVEGRIVLKMRKDADDILARELTSVILSAMGRDDTHNGYKVNK